MSEILLKTVELACKRAADFIMEVYDREELFVEIKADDSPVTLADKGADSLIVDTLKEQYPDYGFLTEESEDDLSRLDKEYVFIIDPLDGTKEFIKRNGDFSILIALVKDHRPVFGYIYAPVTGVSYYAIKGEGAFEKVGDEVAPLHVSERTKELRIVRSRSNISEKLKRLFERDEVVTVTKMGSALKGCAIAKGEAEAYFSMGYTMEWDTCAMDLIVHEAGGVLRDFKNQEILYNRRDPINRDGFYALNRIENLLIKEN
ncbi:3'(2'),5'-bisphosphate nucleotidase CysQ family protein [Guggenheimella bovis]